jgi:hypothetical protein
MERSSSILTMMSRAHESTDRAVVVDIGKRLTFLSIAAEGTNAKGEALPSGF